MEHPERWLEWAVELQSLAQAGLTYGKDIYDRERYTRIREIAAEMVSFKTDIPIETVTGLFCDENGYQTPKIDTRAAVFREGNILLVRESNGKWALPGGWCDVNLSVAENAAKEVKEESGLDVIPEKIIAVQDRAKHNRPLYAHSICKIFVQCTLLGGAFSPNSETTAAAFFPREALPELSTERNTEAQIRMCFDACSADHWITQFD